MSSRRHIDWGRGYYIRAYVIEETHWLRQRLLYSGLCHRGDTLTEAEVIIFGLMSSRRHIDLGRGYYIRVYVIEETHWPRQRLLYSGLCHRGDTLTEAEVIIFGLMSSRRHIDLGRGYYIRVYVIEETHWLRQRLLYSGLCHRGDTLTEAEVIIFGLMSSRRHIDLGRGNYSRIHINRGEWFLPCQLYKHYFLAKWRQEC